MTRSSFAKSFNMAGKELDVLEKNSHFHKNWEVLFLFFCYLPTIFIRKFAFFSGSTAFTDLLLS